MSRNILDISEIKKQSVEELFKKFSSNENGLSDNSVNDRIKEYGRQCGLYAPRYQGPKGYRVKNRPDLSSG